MFENSDVPYSQSSFGPLFFGWLCLRVMALFDLMYEVKLILRKPLSTAAIVVKIREDLQLSRVHATSISAKQNGRIREPLWNGAGQLLT